MKVLGIESTAHTFGVGIYDSKLDKILSNEKAYYKTPAGQGIIPRKASEHHAQNANETIRRALKTAKLSMKDIDVVAYCAGPGLGPCLQIGCACASFLSAKFDIALVAINHCQAHIEIAKWQTKFLDPIIVYVSGANTQIIVEQECENKNGESFKKFRVLGETLDIGLGNLFDMFSRELKDEFGHGSTIAKKALRTDKYELMPYTIKGMNFAFSGLFSYAKKKIGRMDEALLCNSFMQTAFCEVCEASERALMLYEKKQIIACGGVAQNKVLIQKLDMMAKMHGAEALTCDDEFNADNGAMVAYAGYLQYITGKKIDYKDAWTDQKWRVDA